MTTGELVGPVVALSFPSSSQTVVVLYPKTAAVRSRHLLSPCLHHLPVSSEAPPLIAATSVAHSEYDSQCAVCPASPPAWLHLCFDTFRSFYACRYTHLTTR